MGSQSKMDRPDILFVEARVREDIELDDIEDIRKLLEVEMDRPGQMYDLGVDILADSDSADLLLRGVYGAAKTGLSSLKVVECTQQQQETQTQVFSSDTVRVRVQVYQLYTAREKYDLMEQADVSSMPHVDFDGKWDELMFDDDLKSEMMRLMTNILRFSVRDPGRSSAMNPLILLYGPPGSGKTTLAQALAQKISIRLRVAYPQTKLIQIKPATLLSKYYSESAKKVDEIFTAIEKICDEDRQQFVCVLIDEVESIASSREFSMHGEAQDSLRATNALLTGLDRAKKHPNIIFLCTSNMVDCLDAAFLDRCGLRLAVDVPRIPVQYEILRHRIQNLVKEGMIKSKEHLPPYRDAMTDWLIEEDFIGSKLLAIVKLINGLGTGISGRTLTQLPEQSILRYLGEEETCDMEMALHFISRSVVAASGPRGQKRKILSDDD